MINTIILVFALAFSIGAFACGIEIIHDINTTITKLDEIKNIKSIKENKNG